MNYLPPIQQDIFVQTILDRHHDIELDGYSYNGTKLVALVSELVVGPGGKVVPGSARYQVTFKSPVAHALTEEFPAVLGDWVRGPDSGFLRQIENQSLAAAVGLNDEQFDYLCAFALVSAHEVLVVFCEQEPQAELLNA